MKKKLSVLFISLGFQGDYIILKAIGIKILQGIIFGRFHKKEDVDVNIVRKWIFTEKWKISEFLGVLFANSFFFTKEMVGSQLNGRIYEWTFISSNIWTYFSGIEWIIQYLPRFHRLYSSDVSPHYETLFDLDGNSKFPMSFCNWKNWKQRLPGAQTPTVSFSCMTVAV